MKIVTVILPACSLILTGALFFKRDANIEKKTDLWNSPKPLFQPVNYNYNTTTLLLPQGFQYQVIFSEGDEVTTLNGATGKAKKNHDFVAFKPIDKKGLHGYLYVSHETRIKDSILGDGGGGTILEIKFSKKKWNVIGNKRNVDFRQVGGTILNCGGTLTPAGFILSAEEIMPLSNNEIQHYMTDIGKFNGKPRFENYGWMVMIDPQQATAVKKITNFGRYVHEDAHCTADGMTVYLTDDYCPGVFFKFECVRPNDYSEGQLYAYQQSDDGNSGTWLPIPMNEHSLKNARQTAISLGATMFVRQEWVDEANGKIYITETGTDTFDLSTQVAQGGRIPFYLKQKSIGKNKFADPFGRILVFDPVTNKMETLMEGGPTPDGGFFSNPDGLHVATIRGKTYLIINEDIIGLSLGRVSKEAELANLYYNDIYFYDISSPADRGSLKRFAVGPRGCETTGSWFVPSTNTYFFSVHAPDRGNPEPFNKSCVVAVSGF